MKLSGTEVGIGLRSNQDAPGETTVMADEIDEGGEKRGPNAEWRGLTVPANP